MDLFNASFLGIAHEGSQISVWDRDRIGKLQPGDEEILSHIVRELGVRSGRSQGLSASITTLQRVRQRGHLLLIHCSRNGASTRVNGFIKAGLLNLFLADDKGTYDAVNASCVLDFYVLEVCQRQGVGKALFDFALNLLSTVPQFLAYDRPSSKLVAFLAKHYGLIQGITQPNNFVIFRGFFQGNRRANHKESRKTGPEYENMSVLSSAYIKGSMPCPPRCRHYQHAVVPQVAVSHMPPALHPEMQRNFQADGNSCAPDMLIEMSHNGTADDLSMKAVSSDSMKSGNMKTGAVDYCVLPHATRTQRDTVQNHAQGGEFSNSREPWSLPSVESSTARCKDTQEEYDGRASVDVWDSTGRVVHRVADPELSAALKQDKSPTATGNNLFGQSNHICGLLFDKLKTANRSGLQYTLGGVDSTVAGGNATAWIDPSGRDKHYFHRRRR